MSIATLADIITKVRKLTGTGNSLQITDANIADYINSFYLYDFPAQFRTLQLKQVYTFNTIQNIDTYPFDYEHYSELDNPAWVDKRSVPLMQRPWEFWGAFYNWQYRETLDSGDGTTGPYTGTVSSTPIIRSYNNNPIVQSKTLPTTTFTTGSYPPTYNDPNVSRAQNILIVANTATGTLHVTDDGNGNLIGDATGTIDYSTGEITGLTFTSAVPDGADIEIKYNPANANVPQAILFWQNNLILRPVPDKGYTIQITAYKRPSQVLLGTSDTSSDETLDTDGVPELLEWWETLAAGAAKKIFEDRQDEDGVVMMDKMLAERYALNETRTYAQLSTQRVPTIFSGQLDGGYSGYCNWGAYDS